jgi:hypothetical protein
MIALGVALFAIGLGDLLTGGLGGEVRSWQRAVGGTAVAVVTAGFAVLLIGGWNPKAATLLLVLVALSALPWSLLRMPTLQQPHQQQDQQRDPRAPMALTGLFFPLLVVAAVSGTWPPAGGDAATKWLSNQPFKGLAGAGLGPFCLAVGVAVALVATANGVVRSVLQMAGTPVVKAAHRLRGGRLIGPLERLMIFGLAVAGEPTAAALVVSAKSLLRFPELSKMPSAKSAGERGADCTAATGDQSAGSVPLRAVPPNSASAAAAPAPEAYAVDYVTEYFLLGSLTSWILALAPAVLLAH